MAKRKAKKSKKATPKKKIKAKAKKPRRRNRGANPGLKKGKFSKIKQEYHDLDYADKLDPESAAWMSTFMDEYLGANLNHEGKKLHRTKRLRKDCFDRNNKRNVDIQSVTKATGRLDNIDNLERVADSYENELIDFIDSKSKTSK